MWLTQSIMYQQPLFFYLWPLLMKTWSSPDLQFIPGAKHIWSEIFLTDINCDIINQYLLRTSCILKSRPVVIEWMVSMFRCLKRSSNSPMTTETHAVIGLPPSCSGEHQVMITLLVLRPVITGGGGGLGLENPVSSSAGTLNAPFPLSLWAMTRTRYTWPLLNPSIVHLYTIFIKVRTLCAISSDQIQNNLWQKALHKYCNQQGFYILLFTYVFWRPVYTETKGPPSPGK
jgi:hypothetical protein